VRTVDCVFIKKNKYLELVLQSFLLSLNSLIDLMVQSHPLTLSHPFILILSLTLSYPILLLIPPPLHILKVSGDYL
jgi:hypothetical protein